MAVSVSGLSSGSSSLRSQVAPAVLDQGVQSSELVEALAEDQLAVYGLAGTGEPAVVAGEEFCVSMKRGLRAGR